MIGGVIEINNNQNEKIYSTPIKMTQQFRFCGNPFRVDTYRGCDFGCNYCFANARNGAKNQLVFSHTTPEIIHKIFYNAFETELPGGNATYEMMRHRIPFHCGGMSDPFQKREFEFGVTKCLIEESVKYNYPIMFSTKTSYLPEEYFDILDPKIHAFQISLMGIDEDFLQKYEGNTPSSKDRIEFVKKLKSKGFWVGIRIQPLIDLEQAKKVVLALNDIADFFTVEHLKIPCDNKYVRSLFEPMDREKYYFANRSGRSYELKKEYKIQNLEELRKISKKPIGAGDNDIHYLCETRNCCGIDTIGGAFDNYLKYNLTYFATGDYNKEELWAPVQSVANCFMAHTSKSYGCESFKDFVDIYCMRYPELLGDVKSDNVSE